MAIFDGNLPYTNIHELNLDWIIGEMKKLDGNYTDLVNYINNLPVETTVKNQLNEWLEDGTLANLLNESMGGNPVNVLSLGVVADGVTDISPIINNYTGNKALYFPCGNYYVGSPLNIKTSIYGIGYNKLFDGDGVNFISGIEEPAFNQDNAVIKITDPIYSTINIEGINIYLHSREVGIYTNVSKIVTVNIYKTSIHDLQTNGMYFNSSISNSRMVNIDKCSIWSKNGYYSHDLLGIMFDNNTTDSKINDLEIMGIFIGLKFTTGYFYVSNTHLWGGIPSHGPDTLWQGSIGIIDVDARVLCTNIYLDTFSQLVNTGTADSLVILTNLQHYYDDVTVTGNNITNLGLFYGNGSIVVNGGIMNVSERFKYLTNNDTRIRIDNTTFLFNGDFNTNKQLLPNSETTAVKYTIPSLSTSQWYCVGYVHMLGNIEDRGFCKISVSDSQGANSEIYLNRDWQTTALKNKPQGNLSVRIRYKIENNMIYLYAQGIENAAIYHIQIEYLSGNYRLLNMYQIYRRNGDTIPLETSDGTGLTEIPIE